MSRQIHWSEIEDPPAQNSSEAIKVDGIYLTMSATNPATSLGYGTWSLISAGRMLVGVDAGDPDFDVAGDTGGAKTHTLTSAEMPAHTHVQDSHGHGVTDPTHNHTQNAHSHGLDEGQTDGAGTFMDRSSAASATTSTTNAATATNNAAATGVTVNGATATNQSTGGGGAHNNMPPFFAVYMFRRTA